MERVQAAENVSWLALLVTMNELILDKGILYKKTCHTLLANFMQLQSRTEIKQGEATLIKFLSEEE